MAVGITQLADLIQRDIWTEGVNLRSIYRSAVFNSGAVANDALLTSLTQANQSGVFEVPYLLPLDVSQPNISDDSNTTPTPHKLASAVELARKSLLNNGWALKQIVQSPSVHSDPIGALEGMVGDYWAEAIDREAIAVMKGIIAESDAAHQTNQDIAGNPIGDLIHGISITAGVVGAANRVSAEALISARHTLGDRWGALVGISMHSDVFRQLQINQQIDFRPGEGPAGQPIDIPFFQNLRVHVSDACPVDNAVAGFPVYDTYLYVDGALRYGEGAPPEPVEIFRDPAQGNGAGQWTLWSRKEFTMHCAGYSWVGVPGGANQAGISPQWTEREIAANWNRVVTDRKRIGIACLKSNG